MSTRYKQLTKLDMEFIKQQKLFYISSCSGKEVNLSPKGYDSIKVKDDSTLIFLSYPGSTNRTYRDASNEGEFTLLFNAFEGNAKILRLFCKANIISEKDSNYTHYLSLFKVENPLVRNIFELNIYAIESSCGDSVPIMEYKEDRNNLKKHLFKLHNEDKLTEFSETQFTPPDLKRLEES